MLDLHVTRKFLSASDAVKNTSAIPAKIIEFSSDVTALFARDPKIIISFACDVYYVILEHGYTKENA
jgi:hypothetical protein